MKSLENLAFPFSFHNHFYPSSFGFIHFHHLDNIWRAVAITSLHNKQCRVRFQWFEDHHSDLLLLLTRYVSIKATESVTTHPY